MISKSQTKLIRSLEMKKHRQREGLFVAEGPKVVGDLLAAGFEPHLLFATEEWAATAPLSSILVTPDELRKLSFLQHPQHVLAVFPIPQLNLKSPLDLWSLATGGTQEPSNLPCPRRHTGSRQSGHHHPHSRLVWHRHHRLFA